MDGRLRIALGLALTALFLTSTARAQGGYKTEKRKDLGLQFERAKHYEELPTQPNEEFVVVQYVEKADVAKRKKRRRGAMRPEMRILWIDYFPDPESDAEPNIEPEPEPAEKGRSKSGKVKVDDKPITTVERWVEKTLRKFEVVSTTESKRRPQGEYVPTEMELEQEDSMVRGWAFAWRSPKTTIAVVGVCSEEDLDEQRKIWRKTAERMKITEPEGSNREKWDKFYERRNFIDPSYRAEVRANLSRGWKAEDTDNYIVVYSTKDQPLVRRISREIEQIRKAYLEIFPPAKPIEAVSTVRVCKSPDEYFLYGGPKRSAGYWNYRTEELVLYDFRDESKEQRKDDTNTFIVLYHEALHQYIYYSAGEVSPHSWFNEGHGDYFSGALIKGGKLKKIGVNSWRAPLIQRAVQQNRHVPFEEIVEFEQSDYYNPKIRSICYAQGWAMVYFLRDKKVLKAHPEWADILETYFSVLKSTWDDKYRQAGKPDDYEKKAPIQLASRQAAVAAAFEGIDLKAMEREWKKYVLDLELPKKKRR